MFSSKWFRLYAFVLFMSSALTNVYAAQIEKIEQAGKAVKTEKASPKMGRKFQTDYNLMQNLLMQLESEKTKQPVKVDTEASAAGITAPITDPIPQEDSRWLEDEVGSKQAGTLKHKKFNSEPDLKHDESAGFTQPAKSKTRIRVRSR